MAKPIAMLGSIFRELGVEDFPNSYGLVDCTRDAQK